MQVKKPTLAQRKFVKAYLQTGSGKKAAAYAYPNQTKDTQHVSAYHNLNKSIVVRKFINELLDAEGLTNEKIAKKLNRIVDAGTTEQALKSATTKDAFQALKFASELKDILPAKKIEQKSASLNVSLEGKSDPEIRDMLRDLTQDIHQFERTVEKTNQIKSDNGGNEDVL